MPHLTMPFPGSAAASLPDGLRLQRRPYKLDSPPVVALASNNRGRQKRVLGGSGTPSWFLLCPAKIIVSREYVDYSCPSLCGRPLAAMMNLPAASFSWRHGLFGFKVQAVLLFGREIRTAACHSLCCYLFRGCPFPRVCAGPAATAATQARIPDSVIQALGRCSSPAFLRYM